ncbi:MAG TPA: aspartate/glutamate racemase family protein [Devosia sp.]|nr:aspartate/glutamate racemase family protein [Devosia sp.]
MRPRITLLHATQVAVDPVKAEFLARWPEAELVNLLDDSLSPDRARDGSLTDEMIERFVSFGRYGASLGAEGMLVTCSAFGPAIERLATEVPIPVLKPNEAMFELAVSKGSRIGMLATFGPAVATMEDEFSEYVARTGSSATLQTVLVEDAMKALRSGDSATHNRLLAEHVKDLGPVDIVMLAHFSTSRAVSAVSAATELPVLSAPGSAVERMRQMVAPETD